MLFRSAATDQSTDTCTNNFATLNSLDSFSSGAAFSEGNTTVTSTNGGRGIITATFGLTSGKWYWEVKTSATGGTNSGDEWNHIGIANRSAANADNILAESGTGSNKDRKSTRLNSSHGYISYAVFCLKKKKKKKTTTINKTTLLH